MKIRVAALILALGLIPGEAEVAHNHHDGNRHLQAVGDEKCTAFVEDLLYDDRDETAPPRDKRTRLSCFMSDGRSFKIPFADAEYIKENFLSGLYESGKTELILGPGAMMDPSTNELVVSSAGAEFRPKESSGRRKLTTGTKTLLVVRVVASNGSTTASQTQLSDSVFGTSGDSINLTERYDSCSHGKLTFNAASGSNISAGTTQVSVSTSTNDGDFAMSNAITSALNTLFGVSNPDQIADHVMYCLPDNTMSGIAYATFGGWRSVYSDDWCTYPSVGVHEIGHNLVLDHSSTSNDEYGDQSGAMGYSYSEDDTPQYCFNAAKLYTLGWFSARSQTISASGTTSYSGNIADLTQDPDAAGSPILFFLDGTTDYYLNYNRATGINAGTRSGANQVRIVQNGGTQQSIVQASLAAGGSWTSPAVFGGNAVTVLVNSIAAEANINISIAGEPVTSPVTAPITSPVAVPPVTAPITSPVAVPPVTAPITMPITSPVVPPVTAPVMAPVAAPTGPCNGDSSTFTFVLDNIGRSVSCKWLTQNSKKITFRKGKYCGRTDVSGGCCSTCGTVTAPVTAPITTPVIAPVTVPVTAPVSTPVMAPVATPTGPCNGDSSTFTFVLDNISKSVGCKWLTQNKKQIAFRKGKYCGRTDVSGGCCSTCGAVTAPVTAPVSTPVMTPVATPTGQCTGDSSTFTFVLDNGAISVQCKWLTQNSKKTLLRTGRYCSRAEVIDGCCATCS